MPKRQAEAASPAVQPSLQTQLPQLPDAVLISILQHVPTVDRLTSCTLVCKAWASAVASTILHLEANWGLPLSIVDYEGCRRIQSWLEEWGPQVASINLQYDEGSVHGHFRPSRLLLLPHTKLYRLEDLHLINVHVVFHTQQRSISTRSTPRGSACHSLAAADSSSLAASTAAAAMAHAFLPQLRELQLWGCRVKSDSFQQLSKLTALTGLHLHNVDICTGSWHPVKPDRFAATVTDVLQHLQGLERLFLGHGIVLEEQDEALAPLSTMQHLQQLTLSRDACRTDDLTHLPTSLTYLALMIREEFLGWDLVDLAVTPASLPQLTSLQSCTSAVCCWILQYWAG